MKISPITLNYFFGVNCYLIETDKGCFLIDTGIKAKRHQLEAELGKAGCQLGDLKLIIITHGHTDHVGNAAYLRDKYGTRIAMHREDVLTLQSIGVIPTKHVLVPEEVREHREEGVTSLHLRDLRETTEQ